MRASQPISSLLDTPFRRYASAASQPCRDYGQAPYVNGRRYDANGVGSRASDGTWRVVHA